MPFVTRCLALLIDCMNGLPAHASTTAVAAANDAFLACCCASLARCSDVAIHYRPSRVLVIGNSRRSLMLCPIAGAELKAASSRRHIDAYNRAATQLTDHTHSCVCGMSNMRDSSSSHASLQPWAWYQSLRPTGCQHPCCNCLQQRTVRAAPSRSDDGSVILRRHCLTGLIWSYATRPDIRSSRRLECLLVACSSRCGVSSGTRPWQQFQRGFPNKP